MGTEISDGIARAWDGTFSEDKDEAITFIREYARDNLYFNGGEVLTTWRKTENAIAQKRWRNKWGAVITTAARMGIMFKVGRVRPQNNQSHTLSLVRWKSRVFTGRDFKEETDAQYLTNLRTSVHFGDLNLESALLKAYEHGFEMGVSFDIEIKKLEKS